MWCPSPTPVDDHQRDHDLPSVSLLEFLQVYPLPAFILEQGAAALDPPASSSFTSYQTSSSSSSSSFRHTAPNLSKIEPEQPFRFVWGNDRWYDSAISSSSSSTLSSSSTSSSELGSHSRSGSLSVSQLQSESLSPFQTQSQSQSESGSSSEWQEFIHPDMTARFSHWVRSSHCHPESCSDCGGPIDRARANHRAQVRTQTQVPLEHRPHRSFILTLKNGVQLKLVKSVVPFTCRADATWTGNENMKEHEGESGQERRHAPGDEQDGKNVHDRGKRDGRWVVCTAISLADSTSDLRSGLMDEHDVDRRKTTEEIADETQDMDETTERKESMGTIHPIHSTGSDIFVVPDVDDAAVGVTPEPSPGSPLTLDSSPPSTTPTSRSLDCRQLLDQTDWSLTPLGPRKEWSPSVEMMIKIIMASETQDALWLGEECVMIYNQHYAEIVDHPHVFGRSANIREAWGPVFDGVRPLIRQCLDDGIAYHTENDLLLYKRGENGQFVEKYHTWSFIPIFDLDGKIPGIYNPTTDSTDAVLAYRRQQTTKSISDRISIARTVDELFKGIAEAMEGNSKDVPFLLCYGIEEKDKLGEVELTLQSSVGVPEGHSAAPRSTRLKLPSHGRSPLSGGSDYDPLDPPTFSGKSRSRLSIDLAQSLPERGQDQSWPITEALLTRRSVYVEDCSTLIAKLPLRRWEQLPESAIVVPICNEMSNDSPRGLFIMGLNLLRPLDDEYRAWIEVTRSQLTSALFSVHAYAAEHQRVADKDRLERAKTAWFQGAAHDLRSPLTLVVGPLGDVLESNDLKPDHRQALVLAQRNVQHIQRLVNALLDFSRIEAGKLTARYVLTDLGRFVDDLTALFRPAVVRRGIEYTILTAQHETLTYVDPTLLETVIVNLLSNALKYTEKGSITTQLVYTATHAEIAVIDTGFGIPRAEVHAVTDRFHRATTASYRGTEGTGIGLALAKQIVQLHGGDLTIESRVAEESPDGSHGSTFKVRIPLVERDTDDNEADLGRGFGTYGKALAGEAMQWPAADLENEMIETSRSSTSENGDSSATSEGLLFEKSDLLLIVDDNHDIRRYIKQIFSPFCKVVEASNGYDAIELARQSSPDLILSDLMMPRMTGQELLSAIRQDSATRSMPVVLLSAATDDHSRLLALTTGADDFISKPFKPKELLARVNLHMQLGKRRIKLEELFHQREQEISLLSDYCPAGIIRQTADGNMIYGNASWREYAGMQGEQDLNNWIEKVRSDDAQVLMTRLQEFRHGDERELQQTWKWLNGRVVTGTFIRLDKVIPGMSGILGCFSDISYQEERILQAETRRIEAEESRRQQELLVDFTSHEIRTPVSAILQCSALVKENLMALMKTISDVTGAKGITNFVPTDDMMADLEEDIEALESIYQCGLVQERIANDILSLARIQLDTLTFYHEDVDLRKEGRKLARLFSSEVNSKKIKLLVEFGQWIEDNTMSIVQTDHVRLGQVMTNLVSNAIKFTSTSTVRRITVRLDLSFIPPSADSCELPPAGSKPTTLQEETPIWLFISVNDTGPGLSPSERAVLFQKFSRKLIPVSSSFKDPLIHVASAEGNRMIHSRYGGSGLGLFICKSITEMLGGRIEVESQLGQGSTFRFFIQCRNAAKVTLRPSTSVGTDSVVPKSKRTDKALNSLLSPSPIPVLDSKPRFRKQNTASSSRDSLHVLIVEDNIINQTVLKRQMNKAGFTCDVADNGQEALDRLHQAQPISDTESKATPYDVVLMDLEMPIMDGLTAIRTVRTEEESGRLKSQQLVMALTGNARQEQIDQALTAGMDDVVIKPYRLPDLLDKIRKATADRRAQIDTSS